MRSDAEGAAFVGGGDESEEQLCAGVIEWCEAEFVDEYGVVAEQVLDNAFGIEEAATSKLSSRLVTGNAAVRMRVRAFDSSRAVISASTSVAGTLRGSSVAFWR